ncbi:hypothetical protein V6N12_007101 [Hibiscus sabdariffa]|uniref:Uncharacterized protein n=1 Tax=Hibiscus sabdariffa TaxID=183260 RepID=A0ABR2F0T2_9ROSI
MRRDSKEIFERQLFAIWAESKLSGFLVSHSSMDAYKESFHGHGVSKFLHLRMCDLFWPPTNGNLKSFRTFTTLAYLRNGSTKYFDFVVISSRVTGLHYALKIVKHGSVTVITKAESHESNTNYAQGGASAVLCLFDSVESHMRDRDWMHVSRVCNKITDQMTKFAVLNDLEVRLLHTPPHGVGRLLHVDVGG